MRPTPAPVGEAKAAVSSICAWISASTASAIFRPSRPKNPQQKSPNPQQQRPKPKPKRPGRKLLAFDRRLGARFVAGTDEAGRGSLAGPLVVAGVLLDYGSLRDHRVRPLALLNDSKQLTPVGREQLFRAVLACCSKVSVRSISAREIDANGLHRSNLAAMRAILHASSRRRINPEFPSAFACSWGIF